MDGIHKHFCIDCERGYDCPETTHCWRSAKALCRLHADRRARAKRSNKFLPKRFKRAPKQVPKKASK